MSKKKTARFWLVAALLIAIFISALLIILSNSKNVETHNKMRAPAAIDETVESTECTSIEIEIETTCEFTLSHEEQLANISEEIFTFLKPEEYASGMVHKPDLDENALNNEIANLQLYKAKLQNVHLNYPEEFSEGINELVTAEVALIDELLEKYQADIDNIKVWNQRAAEYPAATQIWLSMKEQGWNDYVCAGIMGNMMAECGGQTLDIQWWLYDYSGWFYGICQWSLYYRPEASGLSLEEQLDLLYKTIESEFDYAGFCYYSGFTYSDFLQMTDCREAALAFAKVYERGSPASNSIRQNNAQRAYEYFAP